MKPRYQAFVTAMLLGLAVVGNAADTASVVMARQVIRGVSPQSRGSDMFRAEVITGSAATPELRLSTDDETRELVIHLSDNTPTPGGLPGPAYVARSGDTLDIPTPSMQHRLYPRSGTGLEWEMVLSAPPVGNTLCFQTSGRGLSFHHQAELSEAELEAGDVRPDSVVGSYAVYSSVPTHGGPAKVCHIYRPKAWDSQGDTVWCDLSIDIEMGRLAVTLPAAFLDRAVYPVTVDPTFGTTTVGASQANIGAADCTAHVLNTYQASSGDVVTGLCWYGRTYYDDAEVGGAVYTVTSGSPDVRVFAEQSITGLFSSSTPRWYSVELYQPLAAGTTYAVAIRGRSENT
ncbi:MAG: hypothetical protein KKA42_00735, partial [candidate division Zixibacteria bacterium]|nr:hypothetical protein [candidate division Zixibacteria bacterium]